MCNAALPLQDEVHVRIIHIVAALKAVQLVQRHVKRCTGAGVRMRGQWDGRGISEITVFYMSKVEMGRLSATAYI